MVVNVVYYEDFGAVGDGKTDDFLALKAAHDFANEGGQSVKATPGATYYIKNMDTLKKYLLHCYYILLLTIIQLKKLLYL